MKIKMCGLQRLIDIEYANICVPDYVGFIFADSRRKVEADTAKTLIENLNKNIQSVGVFVNEPLDTLKSIIEKTDIDMIQLHGDESREYIEKVKSFTKKEIWKAFRVQDKRQIEEANQYNVDKYLFDSFSKEAYGGTGKRLNLELFDGVKLEKPFFLAGGFTVEQINEELKKTRAYGVDISSGIETQGWKDLNKMKQVMEQIRRIS
ncbi:MAG: phosphoribosylanthranilate isomerase [Anaerostipes sp.]|nr:phosphoribosylanthranilate isomerase [Anaerostipes sp.]MDD3747019.1 phosphoribosylanthranilate isomerase [Anaerostipes sp.]